MASDNYHDDSGNPVVRLSFCVYADLLGLRSRVQACSTVTESQDVCRELYVALKDRREELSGHGLRETESLPWRFQMFSDSLVLGAPITDRYGLGEPELGDALSRIAAYQMEMVLAEFPVRGGLSVGELHMGEFMCYGKSLIDAHDLESKKERADMPRIILSDHVVEFVKTHMSFYSDPGRSPQADVLLRDEDGQVFVNYLAQVNYGEFGSDLEMLEEHRDFITRNLSLHSHNEEVARKYRWARDYHNHFCSTQLFGSEEWSPPIDRVEALQIDPDGDTPRVFRRLADPQDPSAPLLKSRF